MLSLFIYRLQGENPLARQNQNQSTHAYDKHLLLRIGKSNSPPGYARSSSKDDSILDQKLSIQTRDPNLLPRPAQESSSSLDPTTTWTTSPTSAISLTSKFSWHEHGMDPRSSFSEGTSQLFAVDPELLHSSIPRAKSSKPRSGSMQSSQDTRARSERDSYDSNMYTADAESLSDEASLRSLHMEDRPHRAVLHGTKRRALSPPIESNRAQRQDNYLPLRSPNIHGSQDSMPYQPYNARSLSSTASSTQHSSYASSNMISNPSSSMTSISSLSSIARMVPESSQHLSLPTSLPTQKNLSILVTPVEKPTGSSQQDVASLSITTNKVRVAPSRIGNYYICSCCLKKPKRFETEDQLRFVHRRWSSQISNSIKGLTKTRSSTLVHTAIIVSKTRTRPSDTKILSMCAGNLGLAPQLQHIRLPSTLQRSRVLEIQRPIAAVSVVRNSRVILQIGMNVSIILLMSTNSESVTLPRSFIEPIIFDNTSSIVMQVEVGNGQTFWKINAYAKRHHPSPQACHQQPVNIRKVATQAGPTVACRILQTHLRIKWKISAKYATKHDNSSSGC